MATLEQLIIFFLLIGVGVIARKVGVITPGNTPQLTSLVFNFAMPAIILSGITTEQPHISGKDLSIVLTSAFTTLILLIICSRMLARILRYEREYYGVITVMTTFTNITLSLTDCPIETSAVTAIVTGSTDNTGYYKNEGTAENIQIELRDDQDATLKNGDSKTVIVDVITRNAQFPLKARAITVNGNASQGTIEALINVIYTWQ